MVMKAGCKKSLLFQFLLLYKYSNQGSAVSAFCIELFLKMPINTPFAFGNCWHLLVENSSHFKIFCCNKIVQIAEANVSHSIGAYDDLRAWDLACNDCWHKKCWAKCCLPSFFQTSNTMQLQATEKLLKQQIISGHCHSELQPQVKK